MTYKMMLLKAIYHRLCDWIKVCTKTDLMIALHKFALLAYLALYMFDTNLVHIIPIDPKKMQISYMSLRLVVYGDDVVRLGWQFMRSIKLDVPKFTKPTKQPLVSRLWDFLVQYDGFPVKQAIEVFGLS